MTDHNDMQQDDQGATNEAAKGFLFEDSNANGRLAAEYELVEPLKPASVDLPLLLWVRVRNTGLVIWPCRGAYPINLGYHWMDANGEVVDFEGVRSVLPVDLPPTEYVTLEIHAEPPPHPGEYQLVVDMVEEGVGWFSLQGVPPLVLPVTVAPAPRRPRACIVGALCLINDAVGNTMVNQLRFFQERGYETMILVEHIDFRQPQDLRRHMMSISYEELRTRIPHQFTRRAMEFFHEADVYIFHFPLPYVLFEAIALVERGRVMLDYHAVTPPHLWDGEGKEEFYAAVRRQRELWRHTDYAITHSEFTRKELLESGLIAPERVYVVPLPVELAHFRPGPKPPELLERYELRDEQPMLLYVGRMATNKRIDDLVRALVLIKEHFPDAVLMLVGDNFNKAYAPVAEKIQQLAEALGVGESLIFAGLVPDDALPAHYQLADVFVTASIHEGFCIPVLEAMACGVPVVGADATALPETIGTGGLTFCPEDSADLAEKVLTILGSEVRVEGLETRG